MPERRHGAGVLAVTAAVGAWPLQSGRRAAAGPGRWGRVTWVALGGEVTVRSGEGRCWGATNGDCVSLEESPAPRRDASPGELRDTGERLSCVCMMQATWA